MINITGLPQEFKPSQYKIEIGNFLSNRTGHHCYFQQWKNRNKESAIEQQNPGENGHINLVFVHDILGHHGRMFPLASGLASAFIEDNINFSFLDFCGHGLSNGPRAHVDEFSIFSLDLAQFINKITEKNQHEVVLIGQGMGALSLFKLIEQYGHLLTKKPKGLILLNPILKTTFELDDKIEAPEFWKLPLANYAIEKDLPFGLSKIKVRRPFSGDDIFTQPNQALKYESDPLVSKYLSLGIFRELVKASKEIRRFSYFIDIPSLFLVSGHSYLTDPDVTYLFHKGIPNSLSTLIKFPKMMHEMLFEERVNLVIKEVECWIKENFLQS